MKYDVIILGGGTAGYVSSIVLGRRGYKVLLIEKDKIGGVCVNYGCVPSIFLYDISFFISRLREIGNYKGLDFTISNGNSLDKRDEIIEYLSNMGKKLIESAGVEIIYGEGRIVGKNEVEVEGKKLEFKNLIIASGTVPIKPKIEGIENAISEDEVLRLKKVPNSMIVIGGGYAGVEIAQIFARLGSNVTLLARSKVLKDLSEDARKVILDSLDFDGIEVRENVIVNKIKDRKVLTNQGEFNGEIIVYATGREPNYPKGAELLNLEYNDEGILVNEFMQAKPPNIYAVGDVVSKRIKVAHAAILEALIASLNILGYKEVIDYNGMPQVIYTDPQIGFVGVRSSAVKYYKFPFSAVTRSIISGLREGYVKLGVNVNGFIVYGEVVNSEAEVLVNILSLAIRKRLSLRDLAFTPFVHPSLVEAISNAAKAEFDLDVDMFK
jgi:dihydrolipoamide dehydrogenase